MPQISDEDLELIREELECRAAGLRATWPAREILLSLHRIEALLERLPRKQKAA